MGSRQVNEMKELTDEIIEFVGAVKTEYERRYHIQILMWAVRKSFLRGLERRTSDLDIVFVFQNLDSTNKKIIFERAWRRIEMQFWDIQDILEIISENKRLAVQGKDFKPYYKNNEFKHYILDYYNGFYVGWESNLMRDCYDFKQYCGKQIWNLYEPFVAAKMLYLDLCGQIARVEMGYWLSLNEYINAIWSGMAGIHLLNNGSPSDVHIESLALLYLEKKDAELLIEMTAYFKQTLQKQSNYCNLEELNHIMKQLQCQLEQKMELYQVKEWNIEKEIMDIQEKLKEVKKKYEDESC